MSPSLRVAAFALLVFCGGASGGDFGSSFDLKEMKVRAAAEARAAAAGSDPAGPDPVGSSESVDLGAQFPPSRTHGGNPQGAIADCHDFAAVELLEAGLARAHGAVRELSPADIFVHRTLASVAVEKRYLGLDPERPSAMQYPLDEGDSSLGDVDYALQHGVATLATAPYWSFYSRYRDEDLPRLQEAVARAQRRAGEEADAAAAAKKIKARVVVPAVRGIVERFDRDNPGADVSRRETLRLLQGFRQVRLFAGPGPMSREEFARKFRELDPEKCRAMGADRAALIVKELRAHRPVAVGMNLAQLGEWGEEAKAEEVWFGHDFIILGYEADAAGRGTLAFKTLNSAFSPTKVDNPPVRDDQLCRVVSLATLLAPGESE